MDNLAREIAKLVSHPGFRGFVRSEIAKSKNAESIVDLNRFLERAAKQKNMPPGLAKFKESASAAKGRMKGTEILGYQDLDLYIPVGAHRAKWKGGKDFLVATKIVAYSVSDGEQVILDPKQAPEKVVLIVAPCEHDSHEVKSEPKGAPPPPPIQRQAEPAAEDDEPYNSYMAMSYLKIHRDQEPWTRGDPEVYLLIGQICDRDGKEYYRNLSRVNKENRWYYIRDLNDIYFDSKCSYETYYAVWERDSNCTYRVGGTSSACSYEYHRLQCAPDSTCTTRWIRVGHANGDDRIHTTAPQVITNKARLPWDSHYYDRWYSDTRYASAYFAKRH